MTQVFENQPFRSFYDDGGNEYSDIEFRRCQFVSSRISITRDPSRRSLVRRVRASKCEVTGCALETAIVEDVVIEDLKTHNPLACWGTVLNRVVLRGKIGRIMLNPAVATGTATPDEQRAFDEANAAYYASVEWALDISEAEFKEADIRGIPARLIRRDTKTQAVVTRQKALEGAWQKLDLSKTWWATSIQFLLNRPNDSDVVLVAPKQHRKFSDLLDGLKMLRQAGVAD